jgi:hypothetical protein
MNVLTSISQGLSVDFAIRGRRAPGAVSRNSQEKREESNFRFRAFVCAIAIGTVCIFIRSVYRVAELSEGWEGHLIRQQWLFVGLEGVMVAVGVIALTIAHAAFWIGDVGGKKQVETKQDA